MRPIRIAWVGSAPTLESGVNYMATQLLLGLSQAGVEVDCFLEIPPSSVPPALRHAPGLKFHSPRSSRWEWGRWYSRTPLTQFLSGQASRAVVQRRILQLVRREHAWRRYDFLYRFSQIEMFWIGRAARDLPPIVLHPEVHAAGELRWHRRERGLALACERAYRYALVDAVLTIRARRQRRDIRRATLVVAISNRFADHLVRDYALDRAAIRRAPNAIDLVRFAPGDEGAVERPLRLLFVSRLSVRKGVEMVVELSHRLADLEGTVRIQVVGDQSQWSDYRCLLAHANPRILENLGELVPGDVPGLYQRAAILLQPSHYEPFALTVAEALASGVPVVVSNEVGAGEGVDPRCCAVFEAGDMAGFERSVRAIIASGGAADAEVRQLARAEAERLFDPTRVGATIAGHLEQCRRELSGPRRNVAQAETVT